MSNNGNAKSVICCPKKHEINAADPYFGCYCESCDWWYPFDKCEFLSEQVKVFSDHKE